MCRFLRWLSQAEGVAMTMEPADWSVAAQLGLLAAGIRTRNEAMRACAALTAAYAASGAPYTLADLSVFASLKHHVEMYADSCLPDGPAPVTEHADLEMDSPLGEALARAADPVGKRIRRKWKQRLAP